MESFINICAPGPGLAQSQTSLKSSRPIMNVTFMILVWQLPIAQVDETLRQAVVPVTAIGGDP